MNEYEQYLVTNVLTDAYAKYQGKCLDRLHILEIKLNEYNSFNCQDETYKNNLLKEISDVKNELTKISSDIKTTSDIRISLIGDMQQYFIDNISPSPTFQVDFTDLIF